MLSKSSADLSGTRDAGFGQRRSVPSTRKSGKGRTQFRRNLSIKFLSQFDRQPFQTRRFGLVETDLADRQIESLDRGTLERGESEPAGKGAQVHGGLRERDQSAAVAKRGEGGDVRSAYTRDQKEGEGGDVRSADTKEQQGEGKRRKSKRT